MEPSSARRPTRLALGLAWLALVAGSSVAAAHPACPKVDGVPVCPAPELTDVQEVLDGRLRLVWRDARADHALAYALDVRGEGEEAWRPLIETRGAAASVVAEGATAGALELRIRARYPTEDGGAAGAWTDWSEPRAFVLRAACEGLSQLPASLPRIVADDRDADGRTTGEDLERALVACAEAGGCVIELLPAVYDDVAIVLSSGDRAACVPERTACLDLAFPNGLVIEGHGRASVLRSPLWKTPYRPVPVLELWGRPDVRLTLRNFVLDGRKYEQRDPRPGQNDSRTWWHYGVQVWNGWSDDERRSTEGCIHNLHVRDFMSRGVSVMDVDRWVVEDSTIDDIGCVNGFTDCSALGAPDAYAAGIGVLVARRSDDVVLRRNRIRRATKYSICLKHGTDGAETSIRRPRLEANEIRDAGSVGLFVAGVADGRFVGNTVDATHLHRPRPEHLAYYNTFALSCMGRVERTSFEGNQLLRSAGIAVNWQCAGSNNVFADGRIVGSCREKGPRTCVPGKPNACYTPADFNITRGAAGSLRLLRTEVRESRCATPLDSNGPIDLVVEGGRYVGGPDATRPVTVRDSRFTAQGGARFEGLALDFTGRATAELSPSVELVGSGRFPAEVRAREGASVLDCSRDPSECEARCARALPPEWCSE